MIDRRLHGPTALSPAWFCIAALTMFATVESGAVAARAAEFQLRAECRCPAPVVTLGDVAQVFDADARQADALAALELFPAPPAGRQRFLRLRQLQDLLIVRGIRLAEHRFSGSSQVVVSGSGEQADAAGEGSVSASTMKRSERLVREAVVAWLRRHASETEPWDTDVTLNDGQARLVATAGGELSARGGMPPWVGIQRFEVTGGPPEAPVRFAIDARVTLPPAVVVAARSIPRDAVIRAEDVELQRGTPGDPSGDWFHSIDEVLGQEVVRAIPDGKVLERNQLRPPLLVRRGEAVTVYARSSGIRVRVTARARENGSLGDLIMVESLLNREPYFVRVSGFQEAEIYARAIQADRAAAAGPSGLAR